MKTYKKILLGFGILIGLGFAQQSIGAVLNSNQVGTNPSNGFYLQTNGATSTWTTIAGASSTLVTGTNGVTVIQTGINATASLDTTYAAIWTALETFSKGLTVNGTTTLASTTSALVVTNSSGTVLAFAGSNPCSAGQAAVSISATGTIACTAVVTSTLGNWQGTWQGNNSSSFAPSSTISSQWVADTFGIHNISGNVGIGTNAFSGAALYVNGATEFNGNSVIYGKIFLGNNSDIGSSGGAENPSNLYLLQTLNVSGTSYLSGILNTGNATTSNLTITALSNAIPVAASNGALSNYAGSNCTLQIVTGISATGTVLCTNEGVLSLGGASGVVGLVSPLQQSGGNISIGNSGVASGSYTNANLTISSSGLVTAASNGSAGGGSGNGNLFVSPTSSILANNVAKFQSAGSSTISQTSSLYSFNDGDIANNTSTDNGNLNFVNTAGIPLLRISTTTVATNTPALNVLGASTTAATSFSVFQVLGDGHINSTGTVPTLSSCGTSPTSTGETDAGGEVTVGSVTATGCTITFQIPYESNAMSCTVTNQSMSITSAMTYSYTTTALTISQATGLVGDKLDWRCGLFGT